MKNLITKALFIGALMLSGALWSCNSDEANGSVDDSKGVKSITLSRSESDALQKLEDFNDKFFVEVCASENQDENLVVSPLSASMFLSMLANAADENCESEILDVLGISDIESLNSVNRKLMDELPGLVPKVEVALANSVWYDKSLSLSDEFSGIAKDSYCADLMPCDMLGTRENTLEQINAWASEKTNGLIPHFLDGLPPVESILLNALYFKGKWAQTFDEAVTKDGIFHGADGDSRVPMMRKEEMMRAYGTEGYTAVIKPFAGSRYEAVFVLPDEGMDIRALMSSGALSGLDFEDFRIHEVDFTMPKFKIEPDRFYNLSKVFIAMGIESLGGTQNLRLFSPRRDGSYSILQKATIEFYEQGAKAAAVTGGMDTAFMPEGRLTLTLDRPFVFYIRESTTGVCLFAGKIVKF